MTDASLAAVIGSPVRHSLSPAMHNAAFAVVGRDWHFTTFDLVDGGVPAMLSAMPVLGIAGVAVTMPHKEAAAACVDEVDEAARSLQSVNTVVLRNDGTTFGASTDGAGFVNWVAESGFDIGGARIVVLGAGAAARSIIDALGRRGASDIAIVNRSADAARRASDLAEVARVGSLDDVTGAKLLVNATTVGMGEDATPIAIELLRADLTVADIVYHPLDTSLLRAARQAGAPTIDGLGMLVHQAVLQHELWTGHRPAPAVLRAAAEAELAARS